MIVEEKYVEEGHDYNICIRQTAEDYRCDLHPKIEKKSRNKKNVTNCCKPIHGLEISEKEHSTFNFFFKNIYNLRIQVGSKYLVNLVHNII